MKLRGELHGITLDVEIDDEEITGAGAEVLRRSIEEAVAAGYIVDFPGLYGGPVRYEYPISIVSFVDDVGEVKAVEGLPSSKVPAGAEA